jgi:hypothetical protein
MLSKNSEEAAPISLACRLSVNASVCTLIRCRICEKRHIDSEAHALHYLGQRTKLMMTAIKRVFRAVEHKGKIGKRVECRGIQRQCRRRNR